LSSSPAWARPRLQDRTPAATPVWKMALCMITPLFLDFGSDLVF
jgi:hypothetical protein